MLVFNVIPHEYNGNPRNAGGYCWKDIDSRIPGDDRIMPENIDSVKDYINAIKKEVQQHYTNVVWVKHNDNWNPIVLYDPTKGWGKDNIKKFEKVACINCMWCGGTAYIGLVGDEIKQVEESLTAENINQGGCFEETAAAEKLAEDLYRIEMNKKYAGQPGWCDKCLSFCYGDCD